MNSEKITIDHTAVLAGTLTNTGGDFAPSEHDCCHSLPEQDNKLVCHHVSSQNLMPSASCYTQGQDQSAQIQSRWFHNRSLRLSVAPG